MLYFYKVKITQKCIKMNVKHFQHFSFRARLESFGFHAIVVDGHDVNQLYNAFTEAENTKGKPTCVLAKTFKGNDFPGIADEMNWHGKALGAKSEEIVNHLKSMLAAVDGPKPAIPPPVLDAPKVDITGIKLAEFPNYKKGDEVL